MNTRSCLLLAVSHAAAIGTASQPCVAVVLRATKHCPTQGMPGSACCFRCANSGLLQHHPCNVQASDVSCRAYWSLKTADQWLSLRLDFIGACLVVLVALLAVANRNSLSASLAALSLSEVGMHQCFETYPEALPLQLALSEAGLPTWACGSDLQQPASCFPAHSWPLCSRWPLPMGSQMVRKCPVHPANAERP